jgi:hypothetical protein
MKQAMQSVPTTYLNAEIHGLHLSESIPDRARNGEEQEFFS